MLLILFKVYKLVTNSNSFKKVNYVIKKLYFKLNATTEGPV